MSDRADHAAVEPFSPLRAVRTWAQRPVAWARLPEACGRQVWKYWLPDIVAWGDL
jgi:hypothetical protein